MVGIDFDVTEFAPEEDSDGLVIQSKLQMSVDRVKVVPPPELMGKEYYIHGKISVTDDLDKEPIILFDRPSTEDGELVIFGDTLFGFIPISHSKDPECPCPRPLDDPRHTLFLNFQLCMVSGEDDDDDEQEIVIANFKNHWYAPEVDWYYLCETARDFEVPGESGFSFVVSYAVFAGTHVRVQFTINKNLNLDEEQEQGEQEQEQGEVSASGPNKRKPPICNYVYGVLEACQWFNRNSTGRVPLFLKVRDEPPAPAPVGEPITLDRTIVLAPLTLPNFLYLRLNLYNSHNQALIADENIPFPIKPLLHNTYPPKFIIKKQRTFAKHILDGLITLSVTFLDPELHS